MITKEIMALDATKKVRHIVNWTEQDDNILRKQIEIHGTQNWTIIGSKFKDKTTRQCRRRWNTYLNTDFKKGGWSPQEDMLLCDAQKMYGNRWTEIAKLVSGRTDNAVKNRFTTLCKKRAKSETLAKENTLCINENNKRTVFHTENRSSEIELSPKKMRQPHIPSFSEKINGGENLLQKCDSPAIHQPRTSFSVLAPNIYSIDKLSVQYSLINESSNDAAQSYKVGGTFLKNNDPKMTASKQQEELSRSLALKFNTGKINQGLEHILVFQNFLNESKENVTLGSKLSDMDFQHQNFIDLVDDMSSNKYRSTWKQPDLYEESFRSSDNSIRSIVLTQRTCDNVKQAPAIFYGENPLVGVELQSNYKEEQNVYDDCRSQIHSTEKNNQEEILVSFVEPINNSVAVSALSSTVFNSPIKVTPMFRSLASRIPSPQFSESERRFLLKTFGMDSPSINHSKPPACRRALLSTSL